MAEEKPSGKESIPSLSQQLSDAQSVIENMQRELKVEAALERVRSRAIGMHNSDELPEVVQLLYRETEPFGISTVGISIAIFKEEENAVEYWYADHLDSNLLQSYRVVGQENRVFQQIWQAWRNSCPQLQIFMEGKEKWDYDTFILEDTEFGKLPKELKEGIRTQKTVCFTFTFFKYGYFESVDLQVPAEENTRILTRFAGVFEQTYIRFLDLLRVEAQTREAEIQLALERVRAQTMAMHKTTELKSVIHTLFEQLKTLGFDAAACGLSLFNQEDKSFIIWLAGFDTDAYPESYYVPYFDHPYYDAQLAAWEKGEKYQVFKFEGELKKSYDELIFSVGDYKNLPASAKEAILAIDNATNCTAFMKYGMIESVIIGDQALSRQQADILQRFAKVFEQTYTRFLDIEKAEAQVREAQIEASLEKVRSRTMSMHGSEELEEIIHLIYEQFVQLKIHIDHTGFIIDYKTRDDMHIWLADLNGPLSEITIPYFDSPHWNSFMKAKREGLDFFANQLNFEEKNRFYQELFTYIPELPEEVREFYFQCPGLAISTVLLDNVGLYVENFSGSPYTEEENGIIARFGNVFQQAYTRFLDLQKAEGQAREAEIQLALERIRARTMAMHRSEELSDTASVLFQQIIALDLKPVACAFIIVDEENKTGEVFISADGSVIPGSFIIPYHGEPAQDQILKAWKAGEPYLIVDLEGKELEQHLRFIAENMPVGDMLEASGDAQPDRLALHIINFRYGFLGINYLEPNERIVPILQRFASVFEQTYTRFLDLQNAEAQGREARIEAALEKVRAASMAMHQSEELPNVAQVLVEQLDNLQVKQLGSSIIEIEQESERYNQYSAHDNLKDNTKVLNIIRDFDLTQIFLGREILRRTRALEKDFTIELNGANLKEWMHYVRDNIHEARGLAMIHAGFKSIYFHFAVFHGSSAVVITTPVPMPDDDRKILRRMANTFGVSYQRYLDLLRVEAQAREAQIEAALERVRARTMGMHKSDELKEVVAVLYKEIDVLGLSAFGFELVLVKPEDDILEYWSKPVSLEFAKCFKVPKKVHSFFERQWDAWEKQERRLVLELQGQAKIDFDTTFLTETDYRDLPEEVKRVITEPDSVTFSHALMRHGFLEAIDKKPLTNEEFLILERFATVFEQTYTRFLDLQRAEAQAREAVRQASLDRVRGEIASMRTSEDLNHLTPLIWRELKSLEVPFIRCGVFIIHEEKNKVEVYLTTPEGQALAVLNLDLEANELTRDAVQHWRDRQMYTTCWGRNDFMNWIQAMIKAGQVEDAETYQGASSLPDTLNLHFVPFRQGMLYVGDVSPLANEKLQLVKTLADAFSIAYTRYEDFKNLEEAKTQIESTLHDLKSTQAQLIHSEKMASLGELTAGIAHEIQNPLNFVNNFSEVNRELLLELNEEIKKGNLEEVAMITRDLIDNEEKIYFHGNRAGTIVRGMLEHSRNGKGQKELIDLNKLTEEFLRLAYHGLRAQNRLFKAHFSTDLDPQLPLIKAVAQDIGRVILNLIINAFQAVSEKKRVNGENFSPEVKVKTQMEGEVIEISIEDNGTGIPEEIRNKIFQPFFTTKPTGQGTGLGLSLAYDIIKAHDGEIKLRTSPDTGTCFTVSLPIIK